MTQPVPDLAHAKKIHVLGVAGTLMGAFAAFLKSRGYTVTGSDANIYPPMSDVLAAAGVQVFEGYAKKNLQNRPDVVVIGNVITRKNPEAEAVLQSGLPYTSLPAFLEASYLRKSRNLVVSGTHGKTTTSSLLAFVLKFCGRDPSYFVGGVAADLPKSFHVSQKNEFFVLEGDEYDTAFWDKVPKFNHYLPDDVILTSIEYDHADIYPDMQAVLRAFEGLMDRIRPGGRLFACADYPHVLEVSKKSRVTVVTYGSIQGDFTVRNLRTGEDGENIFEIWEAEKLVEELTFTLPGRHNALNALAVWLEARALGLSAQQVKDGIKLYRGIKRRQEVRAHVRGITVIDDFAHHPTAVKETAAGLKSKYPNRRLMVVFEPRSATSRRKVFQDQYAQAFDQANRVYVSTPFGQERLGEGDRFSSHDLVEALRTRGKNAEIFDNVERGVKMLAREAKTGDVIVVMSNGGFGGFIPKLIEALK